MRADWMSPTNLALSAITLAVVLSVATRPAPQAVDPGAALSGLRSEVSKIRADLAPLRAEITPLRADIAALRESVEQPTATANVDQFAAIQARLERLESSVGGIATKFTALCNAVNSSPFSPPGGAC